jgi:hypothetical protein
MKEGRGIYSFLVGRSGGKRPLGIARCRWEDNMRMNLRGIGIDGANWIQLAQDLCEHGNETSGSIRQQDTFDKLSDNPLFI